MAIGGILLIGGAVGSTKLLNLTDKFKINYGILQVFKIDFSGIYVDIKNTSIINQSGVTTTVNNLYVLIKYTTATGSKDDLFIQSQASQSFSLAPYSQTSLPTIRLFLPLSNIAVLAKILAGSLSSVIDITARYQIAGAELQQTSQVNAASYLQPLKNLLA